MNPAPNATVYDGESPEARNMSTSLPRPVKPVLTEEMLARFASRAASYDRENRFFAEDFEDLRAAKHLLLPLPSEFGGAGMTLAEVCREQRRLAYHAPATALAETCTFIGSASQPIFGAAEISRWNGSYVRQPLARSSQPDMRKAVMMCRFCSRPRKQNGSTAATGSRAGSTLAA
jgi:hypothetical protein